MLSSSGKMGDTSQVTREQLRSLAQCRLAADVQLSEEGRRAIQVIDSLTSTTFTWHAPTIEPHRPKTISGAATVQDHPRTDEEQSSFFEPLHLLLWHGLRGHGRNHVGWIRAPTLIDDGKERPCVVYGAGNPGIQSLSLEHSCRSSTEEAEGRNDSDEAYVCARRGIIRTIDWWGSPHEIILSPVLC